MADTCTHIDTAIPALASVTSSQPRPERVRARAERLERMTAYIVENNGPDARGRCHPDVQLPQLSDLQKALHDAQKLGVDKAWRPYHFQNVIGMKQDQMLLDELLVKKVESVINAGEKRTLAGILPTVNYNQLRSAHREEIAGRQIAIPMSVVLVANGCSTFGLLQRYITVKGLEAQFRDLRPHHLQRAEKNSISNGSGLDTLIRAKIDQLVGEKYGSLHALIAKTDIRELAAPLKTRVAGEEIEVSMMAATQQLGSSVVKIVEHYLSINGTREKFKDLKPYHFGRSPNGTLSGKLIDDLVVKKIDDLLAAKYDKNLPKLIQNLNSKEFSAPLVENIDGHPFEISMSMLRRATPFQHGNLFLIVKRYIELKGLSDVYRDLRPYHLARASPGNYSEISVAKEVASAKVAQVLALGYGGDLNRLIENVSAEELLSPLSNTTMGGETFSVSLHMPYVRLGRSLFAMVDTYIDRHGLKERYEGLRPYHFAVARRDTLHDEILVAKIDHLLATEFENDLPRLLCTVNYDQLRAPFSQIIAGHAFSISPKSVMDSINHKFDMLQHYLALKGLAAEYSNFARYHVYGHKWEDEQATNEFVVKKFDQLLTERFGSDHSRLIQECSAEDIAAPLRETLGGARKEFSFVSVRDTHGGNFELMQRYFTAKGMIDEARELRPYHLSRAAWEENPKNVDEALIKLMRTLEGRFGSFRKLVLNLNADHCQEPFPDKVGKFAVAVRSTTLFGLFDDSPHTFLRRYAELTSRDCPSKKCLCGAPETRARRLSGELSSRDLSRIRSSDGGYATERFGFHRYTSPEKGLVRERIVELAENQFEDREIRYLGLETEQFELLRLLGSNLNVKLARSAVVERDPRVAATMRSLLRTHGSEFSRLSKIQLIEGAIEETIGHLTGNFEVAHLDFFGHLTPGKTAAIETLLGKLLSPGAVLAVTLGDSGLDRDRAERNGYSKDQAQSIIDALPQFKLGSPIELVRYQGGRNGKAGLPMLTAIWLRP